jgi:indoleacetamide hydrolase
MPTPHPSQPSALAAAANDRVTASTRAHEAIHQALGHAWLGAFTHLATAALAGSTIPASPDQRVLNGMPLIIKDNLDVAGMPTTAGSSALAGHVPERSSTAVQRLLDAGAVVIGKANMHELSFGITSNNAAYGPVRNPYASDHIAGGSSGGTAAAVAARLVPAGLGSDTGGSLRIPAALCGIVGFRPSVGRWPSDGVVKISHTRDTVGPMALTAHDCALLDAVVCGAPLHLEPLPLAGVRVGVPKPLFWQDLDPDMQQAAQAVLAAMQQAGVALVDCDVGIDNEQCNQAGMAIAMSETLPSLRDYLASHGQPLDAAAFAARIASPDVKGIVSSLLTPAPDVAIAYQHALMQQRPALQKTYADCFAHHRLDALIFPTTPRPAARIGEDDTVMLNGQPVSTFFTFTRNVGPGSVAGLPGISLPMGQSQGGLPLGIALDGPSGSDRRLLALAMALQALWPLLPAPHLKPVTSPRS